MKSVEWKTYRTRFLVKAKQLSSSLSFTDHLGRQHCGRKGDYLVESCDGVLSIAPRQIFEDIYVPMSGGEVPSSRNQNISTELDASRLDGVHVETLRIEKIGNALGEDNSRLQLSDKNSRIRRKSPQPVRVTTGRLSLM